MLSDLSVLGMVLTCNAIRIGADRTRGRQSNLPFDTEVAMEQRLLTALPKPEANSLQDLLIVTMISACT